MLWLNLEDMIGNSTQTAHKSLIILRTGMLTFPLTNLTFYLILIDNASIFCGFYYIFRHYLSVEALFFF